MCICARGLLDDAASAMLSQVIGVQGAQVRTADHAAFSARTPNTLATEGVDTVLVTFLNGNSKSHTRQIVRRLEHHNSSLRVGIVMPATDQQAYKAIEADDVGDEFVLSGLSDAVRSALTEMAARRRENGGQAAHATAILGNCRNESMSRQVSRIVELLPWNYPGSDARQQS